MLLAPDPEPLPLSAAGFVVMCIEPSLGKTW
jgi:hypothetical protein